MGWLRRLFDYLLLRLDSVVTPLLYPLTIRFYPKGVPQKSFEWVYRRPDPWHYLTSAYEQSKQDRALALAGQFTRSRALEVGCSEGAFTEKLASHQVAQEIVGVDISARAIARARARCARFDRVEFVQTNILENPPAGLFDLVFCVEVLYYLGPDMRPVCEKLGPILAEGCAVILVHPTGYAALHRSLREILALRLVSEHVESNNPRPYLVTVLEKARSPAAASASG
jgi:2-polyprenyl-3-methyl-5-hydroxy-6-metoxy-1,4-benzoquinol methylase